jgi:hypothetical protein
MDRSSDSHHHPDQQEQSYQNQGNPVNGFHFICLLNPKFVCLPVKL